MHEDEAITADDWFHALCGWSLIDVADELGIERDTGSGQIAKIARQQVEVACTEKVALNFDDVERYLSDLWTSIDEDDSDGDEDDSQEDCGRAY